MASFRQLRRLPAPLLDSMACRSRALTLPATRLLTTSTCRKATVGLNALDASKGDRERIVILGSGWAGQLTPYSQKCTAIDSRYAGYVLSQRLSDKYQVLVISPRSYFVFTPLLNSTAVGTLEFRTALEPIRSKRKPHVEFLQGWADDVDFKSKALTVEESVVDPEQGHALTNDKYDEETRAQVISDKKAKRKEGKRFSVPYDKLIVTVGCYSQTFGTPGVKENAFFMKDVGDARRIRKRVLECFEIANLPTTSDTLREQLLRFSIIGGGPTGMEFAAELSDLVKDDLTKLYPALAPRVKIIVRDVAPTVLSMFDDKLSSYAMKTFRRQGVDIHTESHIESLRPGLPSTDKEGNTMDEVADPHGCYTITTKEEGEIGIGMCVWSTGNMMNPFVQKALQKIYGFPTQSVDIVNGKNPEDVESEKWMIEKHPKTGAIIVDDRLRIQLHSAIPPTKEGQEPPPPASAATMTDVFALGDNAMIRDAALPATAQTAAQQAIWLAKRLNKGDLEQQHFSFKNLGIMTYLGNAKGMVQTEGVIGDISGRAAWLIWRGAYLTMSVSWRNKILIPTYW